MSDHEDDRAQMRAMLADLELHMLSFIAKLGRCEARDADIEETVNDPFPEVWQVRDASSNRFRGHGCSLDGALLQIDHIRKLARIDADPRLFSDCSDAVRAAEE